MIRFECPGCGKAFQVEDSAAGKSAKCNACGQQIEIRVTAARQARPTDGGKRRPDGHVPDATVAHLVKIEKLLEVMVERSQRPKEYKVAIIENKLLTAQFDPVKIAALLNSHAQDGWSVKAMTEFNPPSLTGDARAIIVVMER